MNREIPFALTESQECPGCKSMSIEFVFSHRYLSKRHKKWMVLWAIVDHCKSCMEQQQVFCAACCETLPLKDFYYRGGFRSLDRSEHCRHCYIRSRVRHQRSLNKKHSYYITPEEYIALSIKQKGRCAICKSGPASKLHIDHCHTYLDNRGLLCRSCNLGIGHFKDNPELLKAAATYLLGEQCEVEIEKQGMSFFE